MSLFCFFLTNQLAQFAFGARAKYVKTACVASAAVSSCKFQEAYKVDRESNEWKKNNIPIFPSQKSAYALFFLVGFLQVKGVHLRR